MISICGLPCGECGAYIATRENDDQKRKEVAELWSKEYKSYIKPEDINCKGCASDSDVLFSFTQVCEIRKCAREKTVANCAYCDEYACEKLEGFFKMVPDAKKNLDAIKSGL